MTTKSNDIVVLDLSDVKTAGDLMRKANSLANFAERLKAVFTNNKEKPNHKYLINFMNGSQGSSEILSENDIDMQSDLLDKHLGKLHIANLLEGRFHAECTHATLGYLIEKHCIDDGKTTLVIQGSEIRYYNDEKPKNSSWKHLTNDIQIIVTQLPLTNADIEEAQLKRLRCVLGEIVCKEEVEHNEKLLTFKIK